ncbi:hypothetical protein [Thermoactinospora rubra]|uniref:hypothetical protein n=1 Tax=Thermoactinospora rubra TaxID=1088767 RepID=UPI001F0AA870|nr:hypothetical protein [Thermoactinospora rubra]
MTVNVTAPLQYGDPPRVGPFVVQARLHAAPAGFVYLGQAADGRAVSIALLTRGAALDGAARERFVSAVRQASGRRGLLWRGRGAEAGGAGGVPRVLAADLGRAPWVATPYLPNGPGAERFLEPVLVGGTLLGEPHGPDFVPYWLADRAPALPGAGGGRLPLTETRRRVLTALAVLAVLCVLGVVMVVLLVRDPDDSEPVRRPLPATVFEPTPPPSPVTPQPQPSPSPSPSPSRSGPASPGPSPGDEADDSGSI